MKKKFFPGIINEKRNFYSPLSECASQALAESFVSFLRTKKVTDEVGILRTVNFLILDVYSENRSDGVYFENSFSFSRVRENSLKSNDVVKCRGRVIS